jgi:hypothetical protein
MDTGIIPPKEQHRMNRSSKTAVIILALGALLCLARGAHAQRTRPAGPPPVMTNARVAVSDASPFFGPLFVTIEGKEKQIADEAIKAWLIQGGRKVVYSGRDGAGGFENEGQSLRIYDAATGARRKIMSQYYGIDKITEVTTSSKKTALLVEMSDGGLGASYLAVVDPARGEVFFRRWAKIISRRGDNIVIGFYKESDWDKLNENESAKVTPRKTERQNLNTVLKGRIISNKPIR